MSRIFWIRSMMGVALLVVFGLLAAGCDGDGGPDEDADADAEEDPIDDGREDVPVDPGPDDDGGPEDPPMDDGVPEDPPVDDGVPEEDVAEEDPAEEDAAEEDVAEEDVVAEDVTEEDADEPELEPPVDCAAIHESITAAGLLAHLNALEDIAEDNDGNRSAGTGGWDDSVEYVRTVLEADSYTVTTPTIDYPYFEVTAPPVLDRTAPDTHTYTYAADDMNPAGFEFQKVSLSPSGEVTADVTPVDLELTNPAASTSGCEASDFAGFTAGNIALMQRGLCYFTKKARNAQDAGASAVLLINQGTAGRVDLMTGGVTLSPLDPTLSGPDPTNINNGVTIPVLFATFTVGQEIAGTIASGSTVTLHMQVNTIYQTRQSQNVITETAGGDANEVVIFGGHLDSVPVSPGINDNGTGVAALLEIAHVVSSCDPARKMRFAFWGSEEWGQWGSKDYALGLTETEAGQIYGYFNADVLGSVNYAIFVYDGDGSSFGATGVPPSAGMERFFQSDLFLEGLSTFPTFSDRSDHFPFFMVDIAYGGLFSGANGIKTAAEAAAFGGTEGAPHDPCYHMDCDTLSNVDMDIAETMSLSLARAAQYFGVDGMDPPP